MESLDNTGAHGVLHTGQLTGKICAVRDGWGGGGGVIASLVCIES